MELRDEKLDWWIKNNKNVLFIGAAGVGKTTRVVEAFKRNKLKWKYFSAATMDPWVDFIGVPKAVPDDNGQEYLTLIRPKDFEEDLVEAIFLDEFNRSHKKVRNAVMELIQFKSINGREFKNLRIVWAAINPENEDYQVEALDPAQKDRFHVWQEMLYKPSKTWFIDKFGEKLTNAAIDWWESLPEEQQKIVTPRRLEYALDVYQLPGGDIKDVLPNSCNVSKLLTTIHNGPAMDRLKELYVNKNKEAAKKYLGIENNYAAANRFLTIDDDWMKFFLPVLPVEKLSLLVAENAKVTDHVFEHFATIPLYKRIMEDILAVGTNKTLVRRIKPILGPQKTLSQQYGKLNNVSFTKPYYNANSKVNWTAQLTIFMQQTLTTTQQRMKVYGELAQIIPATLSEKEAFDTLELLTIIIGRCHKNTLKRDVQHLMGIINHCLDQINKRTGLAWLEILQIHGGKFDKLLGKISEAKMETLIYCPTKKLQTCY